MGDAVPHASHATPRDGPVPGDEVQVLVHDPAGGLANDDKAHDDRLLGSLVGKEVLLGHTLDKAARIVRGRAHLIEMVGKPAAGHIALASARMISRSFGGKSLGVSRSTGTRRRSSNSACSPPRSNKVAPGNASTRISRSLPSSSAPNSAEPKTRGLAERNRVTTSRTASRCKLRAAEGFMRPLFEWRTRCLSYRTMGFVRGEIKWPGLGL